MQQHCRGRVAKLTLARMTYRSLWIVPCVLAFLASPAACGSDESPGTGGTSGKGGKSGSSGTGGKSGSSTGGSSGTTTGGSSGTGTGGGSGTGTGGSSGTATGGTGGTGTGGATDGSPDVTTGGTAGATTDAGDSTATGGSGGTATGGTGGSAGTTAVSISCGLINPATCTNGEICCVIGPTSAGNLPDYCSTAANCACPADAGSGCQSTVQTCDGPEDCPSGQICCGTRTGTSQLTYFYTSITCATTCNGTNEFEFCHMNTDGGYQCANNTTTCQPSTLVGSDVCR